MQRLTLEHRVFLANNSREHLIPKNGIVKPKIPKNAFELKYDKEISLYKQYDYNCDMYNPEWGKLGSCQYDTIYASYKLFTELIKLKGLKGAEESLGITYKSLLSKEDFLLDLKVMLQQEAKYYNKEDWDEFIKVNDNDLPKFWYRITKDYAYDLWSVMLQPAVDLKIENGLNKPVYGPILNKVVQSLNFNLGIQMAYQMYLYPEFKLKIKHFTGYDT